LGKLDCTTFTEEVSMTPTPTPISSRPGMKVRMLEVAFAKNNRRSMPAMVMTKPERMRVLWERLCASLPAMLDESRKDADGGGCWEYRQPPCLYSHLKAVSAS
jgi:hypothetical protein